jgi:hypothetical protein
VRGIQARDEIIAAARIEGLEMPIERLLRRQNDPTLSEAYRDTLAIATAPYVSPRLSAVALVKSPASWTDQELKQVLGQTEETLLQMGENRDKYPFEVPNGKR